MRQEISSIENGHGNGPCVAHIKALFHDNNTNVHLYVVCDAVCYNAGARTAWKAENVRYDKLILIEDNNDGPRKRGKISNFLTEIFTTDKLPHFHLILILMTVLSYHDEPEPFRPAVFGGNTLAG